MTNELLRDFDEAALKNAKPIHRVAADAINSLESASHSLAALARANGFNGEAGAVLADHDGVLLGVGDGSDPFIAAAAAERLPDGDYYFLEEFPGGGQHAALGWLLGTYRFDRYKKQKPATARLIAPNGVDTSEVQCIYDAISLVRDLVNTPAGDMLPPDLEAAARTLSERFDAKMNVITGDALLSENFPMIHAVGRASASPPRLIDMTWGRPDAPKVTLVGKGVCFDSGGLDLKNASGMAIMKKDMGGAANSLGLAQLIMGSGLDIRLRVLIPAVENAVSGSAFRPGDILKSRKGLSVEIGNTDAEGRLVLADAMALAGEDEPALLVTLATLTGAARVALGPDLPPFYTDDETLASEISAAASAAGDPVWRMPLWTPYDSMLASTIADVNNASAGGFAGSVTAALFLKRFAPSGGSWAHFDIYAWRPKAVPGRPVGGEAQAILALFHLLRARYGR